MFCAQKRGPAASTNRKPTLRTFGLCPSGVHHNSPICRKSRIIVPVLQAALSQDWAAKGGGLIRRQRCDGAGIDNAAAPRRPTVRPRSRTRYAVSKIDANDV